MTHQKKKEHHLRPYKIAAQTAGLVACIFIFFFIGGKGVPAILKTEENQWVPFLPLLILPVTGYIITWYKEFTGALIVAAGGIILFGFFNMKGDTSTGLLYGMPFIIAAFVFFVHINKRNQLKRNTEK
ncbi:MAG: hypothetical protein ABIQ31_04785 [Ferruginibacter sp.]